VAGNAAAGHFGAQVGDFPEAGQDLFAPRFSRRSPSVLARRAVAARRHGARSCSADTGLGFGVGGGVGVEAHGLGGTTIGHGSKEDQAGKSYFLIGDEVADFILLYCAGKHGGNP
jgi:hypothetical protein